MDNKTFKESLRREIFDEIQRIIAKGGTLNRQGFDHELQDLDDLMSEIEYPLNIILLKNIGWKKTPRDFFDLMQQLQAGKIIEFKSLPDVINGKEKILFKNFFDAAWIFESFQKHNSTDIPATTLNKRIEENFTFDISELKTSVCKRLSQERAKIKDGTKESRIRELKAITGL